MPNNEIRYSEFVNEVSIKKNEISYKALAVKPEQDDNGNFKPVQPQKLQLRSQDIYRILGPYTGVRFLEQVQAVVPLAVYLMLFQIFILRQPVQDSLIICGGLVAVMAGLMLFMEGLKLGLMPFGETIGNLLPTKSPQWLVLTIAFLLGVLVTFAEPAIGALQAAGAVVSVERAPYLWELLNNYTGLLVGLVGAGVGLAAILGTLRFIYNWSLKPMIYASLIPVIILTLYVFTDSELSKIIGLAWDCGAVTTGPVTVPLVLSLGIGVASAVGKGDSSLSGFGIVTLASLFPIFGALSVGIIMANSTTPEQIIAAAQATTSAVTTEVPWYDQTPWVEVILAFRAIVPLVIFLTLVLKVILREKLSQSGIVMYGIALTVIGMALFNVGLSYGLAKLGDQSGGLVPAAFAAIEGVDDSPLYAYGIGLFLALLFAWILGFGATLAEPALNALGLTVENLTNGAFKKSLLMYSVSFGVACGIALGVSKLIFEFQLVYVLLPGYVILMILTALSTEEFVNVAWDSAGVTTGPVTVPLVLAMGLGFANGLGSLEGFGILSFASLCPIMSVLCTGLYVQYKSKQKQKQLVSQTA